MKNASRYSRFPVLTLALLLAFSACQKEQTDTPAWFSQEELADLAMNTCLTSIPDDLAYPPTDLPADEVGERATGVKGKFWAPGQILRVRFLNGTTTLRNKVMDYAEQWETHANINFVKVTSGNSDIRVSFDADGNWSYIGKDNIGIAQNTKTMNLHLTASSTEEQIRRVTLHEFGHALGLGHEHRSPFATILWNIPAVYAYYALQGWSQTKVDQQVLNKYQWGETHHTNYDATSIMHYAVSASLTTNGSSVPWNTQLSATDKSFISKMYSSKRIQIRHTANITGTITFSLNGIYHTIAAGETMQVPAYTTGNQLGIWECPSSCAWDAYTPVFNQKYKIVSTGTPNNLSLVLD